MLSLSNAVRSPQPGPHKGLEQIITRHFQTAYLRPIARRSECLFERIDQLRRKTGLPGLILDAGCGTGESTLAIARQSPEAFVLGIDKSLHRLKRHGISPAIEIMQQDNAVLARMDCVDLWRLSLMAGWRPDRQLLLYPNPWPKPRHVMRRWHAHPVFNTLLNLGGQLELRTNWQVFALEFARAVHVARSHNVSIQSFFPKSPLTAFERKYWQSGLPLYRYIVNLNARSTDLVIDNQFGWFKSAKTGTT